MSPITIGIIGAFFLLLMFATGMPIAFVMVMIGVVGFAIIVTPDAALSLLTRNLFGEFTAYSLSAIPMFVLMGSLAFAAGIGRRLFGVTYTIMGHMPGGLTTASVAACAGFGAVCGSATATCATIGRIALPEMRKYGYSDKLATGCIAASGPLGALIPPSVAFVVYGILAELSIGELFLAGIIPGIMIAIMLIFTIWLMCYRNPKLGPTGPRTPWVRRVKSLVGLADSGVLFAFAIGGLLAGWFGPTQAGGIGAIGALIIGLVRREITFQKFYQAAEDAVKLSCMIMMLIITAKIFGRFMAVTGIPSALFGYAESTNLPPFMIMVSLCIIWFILGLFIDGFAILVLLMPLVYPLVLKFGYNPIWFGVIVVVLNHIALVTPPVGLATYVTQAVAKEVSLETVFRGVIPLLVPLIASLILFLIFPQIVNFLPSLILH